MGVVATRPPPRKLHRTDPESSSSPASISAHRDVVIPPIILRMANIATVSQTPPAGSHHHTEYCGKRRIFGRARPVGPLFRPRLRPGPFRAVKCFSDSREPTEPFYSCYVYRCARLHQTMLPPVHPLRSIRRSEGRGVSRPIALPACQLLGPTVSYPDISVVRSRRPAASEFASESQLRSPGGISGPAGHPAREIRA